METNSNYIAQNDTIDERNNENRIHNQALYDPLSEQNYNKHHNAHLLTRGFSFDSDNSSDDDSRYGDYFRRDDKDQCDYPAGPAANFMFLTTFAILFCQYLILTFITPFFPRNLASYYEPSGELASNITLGGFWTGLIFASGPAGLIATMPLMPILLRKAGTKTVIQMGLLLSTIFLVLFGFTPLVCLGKEDWAKWLFIVCRFMYGAGSALAEAGAVATISRRNQLNPTIASQKVLTVMELMAGFGSLVGPAVGGFIYSFYPPSQRLPTVHGYVACFPLFLVGVVFCSFKNRRIPEHIRKLHTCRVVNVQRSISGLALFVNLASFYALETTLQWWLADLNGPFHFKEDWMIGLTLVVASLTYTVVAIPLGLLLDKCFIKSSRRLKAFCAMGLICVSISLLLISSCDHGTVFPINNFPGINDNNAPSTCVAWIPQPKNQSDSSYLSSTSITPSTFFSFFSSYFSNGNPEAGTPFPLEFVTLYAGLVVLGVGQSAALLPVLPDMQSGVSEHDDSKRQAISTLWIFWYTSATALGPIVGTNLRDAFGFGGMCVILAIATGLNALGMLFAMIPSSLNPFVQNMTRSPTSSIGSGSFRFDAQTATFMRDNGALFGSHGLGPQNFSGYEGGQYWRGRSRRPGSTSTDSFASHRSGSRAPLDGGASGRIRHRDSNSSRLSSSSRYRRGERRMGSRHIDDTDNLSNKSTHRHMRYPFQDGDGHINPIEDYPGMINDSSSMQTFPGAYGHTPFLGEDSTGYKEISYQTPSHLIGVSPGTGTFGTAMPSSSDAMPSGFNGRPPTYPTHVNNAAVSNKAKPYDNKHRLNDASSSPDRSENVIKQQLESFTADGIVNEGKDVVC